MFKTIVKFILKAILAVLLFFIILGLFIATGPILSVMIMFLMIHPVVVLLMLAALVYFLIRKLK